MVAIGFSLTQAEVDSYPRSRRWWGDWRSDFLLLSLGLLQNTQEVHLLDGREKETKPCPLRIILGLIGVVRGSGNHRFNVSCSTPPGWII